MSDVESGNRVQGISLRKSIGIYALCIVLMMVFWNLNAREGANKQVISSQADSLIKISRIWADFFPANTSNQPV